MSRKRATRIAERYWLRAAVAVDARSLRAIEEAAGRQFLGLAMSEIADDPPPPREAFRRETTQGRCLVVCTDDDQVAGYLVHETLAETVHVKQVSVHPDHGGNRLGAALINACDLVAADLGIPRLSLTTFRDVPWNRPYYERLGFACYPEGRSPGDVAAILRSEMTSWLGKWPRVAMFRDVV